MRMKALIVREEQFKVRRRRTTRDQIDLTK